MTDYTNKILNVARPDEDHMTPSRTLRTQSFGSVGRNITFTIREGYGGDEGHTADGKKCIQKP